jgi:hypothetical protein
MPTDNFQSGSSDFIKEVEITATPPAIERLTNLGRFRVPTVLSGFILSRSRLPDRTEYLLHHSNHHSRVALNIGTVHTVQTQLQLRDRCAALSADRKGELQLVLVRDSSSPSRIAQACIIDSCRTLHVSRIGSSFTPEHTLSIGTVQESTLRLLDPKLSIRNRTWPDTQLFRERFATRHIVVVGQQRAVQQTVQELMRAGLRHLTVIRSGYQVPDQSGKHRECSGPILPRVTRVSSNDPDAAFRHSDSEETRRSASFETDIFSYSTLRVLKQADIILCVTNSLPVRLATAVLCAAYLKPLTQISILPRPHLKTDSIAEDHVAGRDSFIDIRLTMPGSACVNCLGGLPNVDVQWFDQFRDHGYVSNTYGSQGSDLNRRASFAAELVSEAITFWGEVLKSPDGTSCRFHRSAGTARDWQRIHEMEPTSANCPICMLTGTGDLAPGRFFRLVHDLSYWQFVKTSNQARNR